MKEKIWADSLHEFVCQPMTRAYNAGLDGDNKILDECDKLENKLLKLILKDIKEAKIKNIKQCSQCDKNLYGDYPVMCAPCMSRWAELRVGKLDMSDPETKILLKELLDLIK